MLPLFHLFACCYLCGSPCPFHGPLICLLMGACMHLWLTVQLPSSNTHMQLRNSSSSTSCQIACCIAVQQQASATCIYTNKQHAGRAIRHQSACKACQLPPDTIVPKFMPCSYQGSDESITAFLKQHQPWCAGTRYRSQSWVETFMMS